MRKRRKHRLYPVDRHRGGPQHIRQKASFLDFKKLLKRINDSEHFVIVALDYPVLQKMIELTDIPELHDKIIGSTAKYLDLPIITKDRSCEAMTSFPESFLYTGEPK
jgi:hypothetical protein